ncbi:hypothetical protein [Paenibacillus cymbidii]|uniref:hypothetical protein n=1 Tax=Paenibacillus cymbidii TaxID=1639034 RepID=UPI001080CB8A|nr:hypothetical protein [Paenibacillus cymbidii]
MVNGVELKVGWAQTDITPLWPVFLAGQLYSRLSEGIKDGLTATACAMESGREQIVFVSCDLINIPEPLRDRVRLQLQGQAEGLEPMRVVFNATHTHTAPEHRLPARDSDHTSIGGSKLELDVRPVEDYVNFLSERLVEVIVRAWQLRKQGGIAFGLGYAQVGRNRRWVDKDGKSTMYNGEPALYDSFRHIEGHEDHSVQLLASYDANRQLTGLIVNLACPSQETMEEFLISSDFWHETRIEIRRRFGEELFILPQCSVAGDQSPSLLYDHKANERMLKLKGRSMREEIAHRIAASIEEMVPYISRQVDYHPILRHQARTVQLALNQLTAADVEQAQMEIDKLLLQYRQEKLKLDNQAERHQQPRWYVPLTAAYRRILWNQRVITRYEQQKTVSTQTTELHLVRLGDVAFATVPYEYYLDFGIQIKLRSPALQTFLVQLTGQGSYVPSLRSVKGGGYGSVPASNAIGPEGGQELADHLVNGLRELWKENAEQI